VKSLGKSVKFAETISSYTAVFTFIQIQQIIRTVAIGGRFKVLPTIVNCHNDVRSSSVYECVERVCTAIDSPNIVP
jgi:hypothetical protein